MSGVLFFACGIKSDKTEAINKSKIDSIAGIAEILFEKVENDMGNINEGEQIIVRFDYSNNGDAPLVIQNIEAGCGCTVPSWSRVPLKPGNHESIKVIFNSNGKKGMQNIRISVTSNSSNSPFELRIKGNVNSIN
jgi:hypothetical protein